MKKSIFPLLIILVLISTGCGSSATGVVTIEGPELSLAEAQDLELNHLYVKEWGGSGSRPFFSVYIQDAITSEYLVCVGPDGGLDVASRAGIYYGNLTLALKKVTDAADSNTLLFNIVVVADQEDPCPTAVDTADQIVGSVQVNFSELLNAPIQIGDGAAYVAFRARGNDDVALPDMSAASTDALTLGEIYFTDGVTSDIIPDYYMVISLSNGATYNFYDIIDPSDMPEMREAGLVYSWLDLPFTQTSPLSLNGNLLKSKVKIKLLKNDSTVIGETAGTYMSDLIGRKVSFSNGKGHIRFRETN